MTYALSSIFIFFLLFSFPSSVCAENTSDKKEETKTAPPNTGNFALPLSQQPGPLISFGQNIIDQKQTQLSLLAAGLSGTQRHAANIIPSVLYGITDDFSVSLNVPIAASYKDGKDRSSGFEDAFLQLEHAFYSNKTSTHVDQATIVGSITFPTGSSDKIPPTGFGSSAFFLGGTFSRMYTDWVVFTSHGVILPTSDNKIQWGNSFLYQAGLGRNILTIASEWTVAWMVEADGLYAEKDKIQNITNPNSGGNTVYITPSLWISSKKRLTIQVGFGVPVVQHLFGNQRKNNYLLAASFGWTF